MLKADFHMHSSEDPLDWPAVKHTSFQLVDEAARLGYEVISLTLHETLHCPKELQDYAKRKGLLLIPGMEATVEGKHVLVLNPPEGTCNPSTFEKVEKVKAEGALIIAAHPYYLKSYCLGEKLREHIHLFDAIEHCHFYTNYLNRNKQALSIAEEFSKPMIANSDMHFFFQYNTNYTLVDAAKKKDDVLEAIRKNKLHVQTRPLSTFEFSRVFGNIMLASTDPRHVVNKWLYRRTHPL
ncbi:PHP domain-containing protein [Candidatus Woesearchaeota archaeon]|nr:PHP domain-containing protein [Candidatus Woesearchaeota archaeon]